MIPVSFLIALGIAGSQVDQVSVDCGDVILARYEVDLLDRSRAIFVLPAGPRTVDAFRWIPDPDAPDDWRSARIRLVWDRDDPEAAGVDLPLGRFVSPVEHPSGRSPSEYLNRRSMPYRRSGRLVLDTEGAVRGSIQLETRPGIGRLDEQGYLRAAIPNQVSSSSRTHSQRFSEIAAIPAGRPAPAVRYWYDQSPGPETP